MSDRPLWDDQFRETEDERNGRLAEKRQRRADREAFACWMDSCGLATGHGDTLDALLLEAGGQIAELRARLAAQSAVIAAARGLMKVRRWADPEVFDAREAEALGAALDAMDRETQP